MSEEKAEYKTSGKIPVCLFVRVSTEKQEYDRQINELKEFCDKRGWEIVKIIATKVSGKSKKREDIQELLALSTQGVFRKVILSEISRLGRIAKNIRSTIDYLHSQKISLVFYSQGGIESLDDKGNESFVTNIIISIYAELAQEERRILSERVKSGLQEARRKGKRIGRTAGHKKSDEQILQQYFLLAEDLKAGKSLNECMTKHDLAKNTVLKVKRILQSQKEKQLDFSKEQ